MSGAEWEERQQQGLGSPIRTHGHEPGVPTSERPHGVTPTTPPQPYYGSGPATGRPPQQPYTSHAPSHLAVNAAHAAQPAPQQPPTATPNTTTNDTRMAVHQQPRQQQQQQQWQQQQLRQPQQQQQQNWQPETRTPTTTGYHPRTVPVTQINAQRQPRQQNNNTDLQPVDAMQAIMRLASHFGHPASYPSTQEVADFGRGGSFPRRF